MSDLGEKTCPLCAEEMDLTDQQLKPCKCGYEICVWCWHHIMDMAEKDHSDGRCPACRSPYDKDKIVGMAATCERLVSENFERKKSHKSKAKSSEGKKQLSSVRVIQRNLVYIVGLPLSLADEDLLQHKEYFGQYGKVLKVSMSRTAAGVIQQFPNNTCSVYITYGKEEEAIRCIQSVHGFVIDGRSVKACFGTTKYCHAWLRNVACTNPDCLYLHEIGPQDDSFSKDEIVSAYTRNRVQQITGGTNNLQRPSANVLPSPVDDYSNVISTTKSVLKSSSNNTINSSKSCLPNENSSRSNALPAAASWGMRASSQPAESSSACPDGLLKQNSGGGSGKLAFSSAVVNTGQVPGLCSDALKKPTLSEEGDQSMRSKIKSDLRTPFEQSSETLMSEKPALPDVLAASNHITFSSASPYNEIINRTTQNAINSLDNFQDSYKSMPSKEEIKTEPRIQNLCSNISSMGIDINGRKGYSGEIKPSDSHSDNRLIKSSGKEGLQQRCAESSATDRKAPQLVNVVSLSETETNKVNDVQPQVLNENAELEEDILSFDSQRLNDPEVVNHSVYSQNPTSFLNAPSHRTQSLQHNDALSMVHSNCDPLFVDSRGTEASLLSNGYLDSVAGSYFGSDMNLEGSSGKGKQMRSLLTDTANNASINVGESSIISNILSMDYNTWDESLSSPINLAKFLGETEKQTSSKLASSLKVQNNNQSRFSFARQEESQKLAADVEPYSIFEQYLKHHSLGQDFAENRNPYMDRIGTTNGFPSNHSVGSDFTNHLGLSSSKQQSGASRVQISAPPGFSLPSRSPPPGFSSHERLGQTFETSGRHHLDSSSMLRNSYQAQQGGNNGGMGDIEFMDPAILAVGKGRLQGALDNWGIDMRSSYPQQLNVYENEARLKLLMQKSLSPHQNLRYGDIGDNFSRLGDSYGISSRLMEQSHVGNLPPFAQVSSFQQTRNPVMGNGQWNEIQGGNNVGIAAEILRNERLGLNKFYNGYEESKFRMPSSGDLYNRTYGGM